jgi:hypothetical protein
VLLSGFIYLIGRDRCKRRTVTTSNISMSSSRTFASDQLNGLRSCRGDESRGRQDGGGNASHQI